MKFIDLKDADWKPSNRPLTEEEHAKLVQQYMSEFNSTEAEAEYQSIFSQGGVDADDLLKELEEIHQRTKDSR